MMQLVDKYDKPHYLNFWIAPFHAFNNLRNDINSLSDKIVTRVNFNKGSYCIKGRYPKIQG